MGERDEMIEELKHFVGYYQQALHEFFDDTAGELKERLEAFYGCLDQNQNSLEEYRKIVGGLSLPAAGRDEPSGQIKKTPRWLSYLTLRMSRLLEAPK
ncbi:MAG: hypothetical protein A3C35_00305 [Omnitrophica bacterium RIFCSPHIGHO2_02_FULL_46_11]|nr:MAG: hypothetical protein A3A81_03120 [Omnitrophica bacterium RIFCSPLOWO2_01_FULL_45_10b]OGW86966.1 MAG: hypothetical protein A3C35_00305 [Omnitrophica bacterium RIFCSPHIGHO2_02_FULL_46_11]